VSGVARAISLPCRIAGLVPHEPPALLVDVLADHEPDWGRARGVVRADNPYLRPGGDLDPLVCIEMIAQGLAAHDGYARATRGEPPGGGFLVGVRTFDVIGRLAEGDEFEVEAHRGLRIESFQIAHGSIRAGGREIAAAELKLYLTETAQLPLAPGPPIPAAAVGGPRLFPVERRWRREIDRHRRCASYLLDESFPPFRGHFPGYPLLPAVASAVLAAETVRALHDEPMALARLKGGKFLKPVFPGALVEVLCEKGSEAERIVWNVRLVESGAGFARMTLAFDPASPGTAR